MCDPPPNPPTPGLQGAFLNVLLNLTGRINHLEQELETSREIVSMWKELRGSLIGEQGADVASLAVILGAVAIIRSQGGRRLMEKLGLSLVTTSTIDSQTRPRADSIVSNATVDHTEATESAVPLDPEELELARTLGISTDAAGAAELRRIIAGVQAQAQAQAWARGGPGQGQSPRTAEDAQSEQQGEETQQPKEQQSLSLSPATRGTSADIVPSPSLHTETQQLPAGTSQSPELQLDPHPHLQLDAPHPHEPQLPPFLFSPHPFHLHLPPPQQSYYPYAPAGPPSSQQQHGITLPSLHLPHLPPLDPFRPPTPEDASPSPFPTHPSPSEMSEWTYDAPTPGNGGALSPVRAPIAEEVQAQREAQHMNHKMERGLSSVQEVWNEWKHGINGGPAVEYLENTYGVEWRRRSSESSYYYKRKALLEEVLRLAKSYPASNPDPIQTAINYLDHRRTIEAKQPTLHSLMELLREEAYVDGRKKRRAAVPAEQGSDAGEYVGEGSPSAGGGSGSIGTRRSKRVRGEGV